jgi:diaminohydroxyphosphoribosylaminopyrimidine deaminase/5-amino-6-(5-phosphoribosylamino)uracil reductase
MMARALFWAERGRGLTSPNPLVGAVISDDDGVVIAQGAHMRAGGPHAEVVALERAGPRARGATLYCTLEPCSHHGRTGPCAERVAAAGIRRVVIAATDRNPKVAGKGIAYLQAHGVGVTVGVGEAAALDQLMPFFTWVTRQRPFVVAKTAVSADGFVGPGDRPVRLTGAEADRYFHRQRAEVDAMMVGAGTVLADDPILTPRGAYRARPLVRVVIDWRGRVAAGARLFSTLSTGPVIMVTTVAARDRLASHVAALEARGIVVQAFASRDLAAVLRWLAGLDIVSLVVEGGPTLQAALLDRDLVDRVQAIWTPLQLGSGVRAVGAALAPPPPHARVRQLGADRLVEFDVHRTD